MTVALVGASSKPDRFAYKVFKRLIEKGHEVFLVNPVLKEVDGHPVVASLRDIASPIDTVTLYVGAAKSSELGADILGVKPRRVIFNPGAENPELAAKLSAAGILTVETCSLVLLNTDRF